MLISKFDLYKAGWLDLVFKNRNHQYGAYALRNDYASIMVKSMAVTFFTFATIGVTATIIARNKPVLAPSEIFKKVDVTLDKKVYDAQKPKEIKKPKKVEQTKQAEAPKAPPVRTQEYRSMEAAPNPIAEDPKPLQANVAVASVENNTSGKSAENAPVSGLGDNTEGNNTGPKSNGNEVLGTGDGLQVMPQPVGGDAAWAKFLQKNLRYPVIAQEQGVQGKSFISFIIEKDGTLSNITVVRKAGYGFDEESIRVLKLAKAWKPGMQNGQPVRVRYTIPINFQLAD